MPGFYKPEPNETQAYHNDGTHEYFGVTDSGHKTSQSAWQIFAIIYKTSYTTAGDPWVIKYPVDTKTSLASDQPIFEWDEVESYTYRELGTKA